MAAKLSVGQIMQFATDVQIIRGSFDKIIAGMPLEEKKQESMMLLDAALRRVDNVKHRLMEAEVKVQ